MGIISVDTKYGPLEFEIKGDTPSVSEQLRIQDVLVSPEQYFSDDVIKSYKSSLRGKEAQFDYKTGIQDGKLRRMLGRADTREDEEKVLKESFGLLETEFTRDNRGRLALTPEGAKKFD